MYAIGAIVVLLGLFCAVPAAWGKALYLSSTGKDGGVCSHQQPCATLAHASELLAPGDTLYALAQGEKDRWLDTLLAASTLNTDRYRGMITQPGQERRQARGFVGLATTWSTELRPVFYSAARAIPNLVDALNRQTGISARVESHVFIDTPTFFRSPFLYITSVNAFKLTENEIKALKKYLQEGGFIFADNGVPAFEFSQADAALRDLFRTVLGRKGQLRRIPARHPIYRSFYDFDQPPPGLDGFLSRYYLEGSFLEGRLVAVYARQGYVHLWALNYGNEPQLRFGINAVVFAMQQQQSIGQQVTFIIQQLEK